MRGAISVVTEADANFAWCFDMMEYGANKADINCKGAEKGDGDDCLTMSCTKIYLHAHVLDNSSPFY